MESLKNVYCEKMGLFRFFGGKNFFCGGSQRGRAALDCVDCCEAFRARVDGRSWASVDGGDGGCACLI